MKKLLGIVVLGFWLSTNVFAGVITHYKLGKGPLKVTEDVAHILEYFFSGGTRGVYAEKQKSLWKPGLIAISSDGDRIEGIWKDGELIAFGGLGIVIETKGDYIEIVSTIDDTPAYKAGLRAGDIILQIDDQNVSQINFEKGLALMRGVPGTSIELTIKRPDIAPFVVELTREIISSNLLSETTP